MTSKNQLTLSRNVTAAVGAGEYFEIEVRNGQIVLTQGDAESAIYTCASASASDPFPVFIKTQT